MQKWSFSAFLLIHSRKKKTYVQTPGRPTVEQKGSCNEKTIKKEAGGKVNRQKEKPRTTEEQNIQILNQTQTESSAGNSRQERRWNTKNKHKANWGADNRKRENTGEEANQGQVKLTRAIKTRQEVNQLYLTK